MNLCCNKLKSKLFFLISKKFIKRFKSLKSLSKAKEKDVLKMWEGLGYYRRARNLLNCSKELVKNHNSKIPNTLEELKKLPVSENIQVTLF